MLLAMTLSKARRILWRLRLLFLSGIWMRSMSWRGLIGCNRPPVGGAGACWRASAAALAGQHIVGERHTAVPGPGFAVPIRHPIPSFTDLLPLFKGADLFTDDHIILPNDCLVGKGMNLDGPIDRSKLH